MRFTRKIFYMENDTNPESNESSYKYIPDVSFIMRQGGYESDLIGILAEPDTDIAPFVPEVLLYDKNDINIDKGRI